MFSLLLRAQSINSQRTVLKIREVKVIVDYDFIIVYLYRRVVLELAVVLQGDKTPILFLNFEIIRHYLLFSLGRYLRCFLTNT